MRGTVDLPDDVAFLTTFGFDAARLRRAALRARATAAAAHEVFIAEGGIETEQYHRALAIHLGLRFETLRGHRLAPAAFRRAGRLPILVPFEEDGDILHVCAPRGHAVGTLVAWAREGRRLPRRFALTTPRCLREAFLDDPRFVADRLTVRVARGRSATATWSLLQGLGLGLALVCALLVAMIAAAPMLAGPLGVVGACAGIAIFLLAAALRAAAIATPPPTAEPAITPRVMPFYTLLVPLHREVAVVPQLVAALTELDYPPERLEILCLLEADDRATYEALAAADIAGRLDLVVLPPGLPRTKPRALELGRAFARGQIIGVFDAEDEPAPDQLRKVVAAFAAGGPTLGAVQARLELPDGHWRDRQFALEYAALFHVLVPALASLDLPIMLGGTSNHVRASTLDAVGGWDPWNVTEDADLGIEIARAGFAIGTVDSRTMEEAPDGWSAWFGQRRRWQKGWMQTALVHFAAPRGLLRDLGMMRAAALVALLFGGLAAALTYPIALLAIPLALILDGPGPVAAMGLAVFLGGGAVSAALVALGGKRAGLRPRWSDVASAPVYWLLVSFAAWTALGALIKRPFHWVKTAHHGRARAP